MSVPLPIVRCTDAPARAKLIADLKALGFGRSPVTAAVPAPHLIYIGIRLHGDHLANGYDADEFSRLVPDTFTLVNSPTHMLAYIARHGIKPHAQT